MDSDSDPFKQLSLDDCSIDDFSLPSIDLYDVFSASRWERMALIIFKFWITEAKRLDLDSKKFTMEKSLNQ